MCVLNVLSSTQSQSQECIGTQMYRERKEVNQGENGGEINPSSLRSLSLRMTTIRIKGEEMVRDLGKKKPQKLSKILQDI